MEILEFSSCKNRESYLKQIEACDWGAAKFLATLLKENRLEQTLGGWCKLFLLTEGEELVSFVTLSAQDCVDDPSMTPWLGFLHTAPSHRGHRFGKLLLDCACENAKQEGFGEVYLATDHVGLYEKYGFVYLQDRLDVWGEVSRIYKRKT